MFVKIKLFLSQVQLMAVMHLKGPEFFRFSLVMYGNQPLPYDLWSNKVNDRSTHSGEVADTVCMIADFQDHSRPLGPQLGRRSVLFQFR